MYDAGLATRTGLAAGSETSALAVQPLALASDSAQGAPGLGTLSLAMNLGKSRLPSLVSCTTDGFNSSSVI